MMRKIVGGLLLLFSAFFISLLVTHTALVLNKTPPALLKWFPDLTIGLLLGTDVKSLKPEQYTALITIITLAVGFLIAIFGLLRKTGKLQEKINDSQKELLDEHGISINPVERKGKDDLEWMLPYYHQAERVTIFAGSFDWLGDNRQMKERIRQLAAEDNLRLVSYRTKEQVEAAFQRKGERKLFRELEKHFGYESGLEGVTCTMIQRLGADWELLYRSCADAKNVFNVCYLGTTPRNIELLHILSELTKAVERRSEHTPDSSLAEQG